MPFRRHARITIENLSPDEVRNFFYQINHTLTEVPADRAYFHAQWRRNNPLPYKEVHTLLDGVAGQGHYVGTYVAWGVNNTGWWGEGEIKFLPRWRQGVAYDLWHRHRGLLWRRLGIPFPGRGVRGVHHAVSRSAPSDRPGGREPDPAAFRAVSLARARPHSVQARPARDDPSARLAPAACRKRGAICLCRTTSPPPHSGTRPSRTPRSRSCRT